LWGERLVATIFTIEYLLRWYDDATDQYGWHYPQSWMGIIDLISVLPFWVGFFVPPEYLHMVRTFRVFRLLKFFRYSRSLQLVALGFYRALHHLRALGFTMLVIGLFCSVSVYELERDAQPEKLGSLLDACYFTAVTVATVGYGDISPITPLGRIVTMLTFFFALSIFAGMLGVLGNSFVKVLEEEADPNIDPIDLYRKEQERQLAMRAADKKFMPKYTHLGHDDD
jgi:voltage-gated potassium channel